MAKIRNLKNNGKIVKNDENYKIEKITKVGF